MLLTVSRLSTTFDSAAGRVRAVDDVSFTVGAGRAVGVVGESGSGKTVLSRSIMNLLPRRGVERSGEVRFDGRDLTTLSTKEMTSVWGRRMSMVFQDPMTSLNPVVRVGRQITESLVHHLGMSKTDARDEAIRLLEAVRIPEPERRFREYPHQLSGGMRQRVTIAIAIACSPDLLFADEPTTALDVTVQAQILDVLSDLRTDREMALVLVTHDLGVVAGRTDEIAVMYAGEIVEMAPTAVLFAEMRMPYSEALLRSVPRLDDQPHRRRATIPGRPPNLAAPTPGCRFAPRCAYVAERCLSERPRLEESGIPGHRFACFFPVGSTDGQSNLARNVKAEWAPALEIITHRRETRRSEPAGTPVQVSAAHDRDPVASPSTDSRKASA
ncbi:MAG TPA: ABC transporter ATP-binding protein [Acidimicrobiia bacterium]|nr:ABC transporter ATP-binding protein [Acidimicrobiia bacterium]